MRKAWSDRKTMTRNLYDMGLASDPNKALPVKTSKQHRLEVIQMTNGFTVTDDDGRRIVEADAGIGGKPKRKPDVRMKKHVIEDMEAEANALRQSEFK